MPTLWRLAFSSNYYRNSAFIKTSFSEITDNIRKELITYYFTIKKLNKLFKIE